MLAPMAAKRLPEDERIERQRIGATIRALRASKKLSADHVANRVSRIASFSRPFLANIEAGRRGLPADLLPLLADALECDPAAIVRSDYYQRDEAAA